MLYKEGCMGEKNVLLSIYSPEMMIESDLLFAADACWIKNKKIKKNIRE